MRIKKYLSELCLIDAICLVAGIMLLFISIISISAATISMTNIIPMRLRFEPLLVYVGHISGVIGTISSVIYLIRTYF